MLARFRTAITILGISASPTACPLRGYGRAGDAEMPWSTCIEAFGSGYVVMAYIVMAYIAMAHIVMAFIVMAYIVVAYIVLAYIVMAYKVMSKHPPIP